MAFGSRTTQHASSLSKNIYSKRLYSTPVKPSVKLIAEIRKHTQTSMVKAREALAATNNDLEAALQWLEKDLAISGAKKAAKLEGRITQQGLIAVATLSGGGWKVDCGKPKGAGIRAAMIELNCETDFVARNDLFRKLAQDISHTAAFISEAKPNQTGLIAGSLVDLELLQDSPLLSPLPESTSPTSPLTTVSSAIRDTIAKIGEKISLRRVCSIVVDPLADPTYGLALSSFAHGGNGAAGGARHVQTGRLASLTAIGLRSNTLPNLVASETFLKDFNSLSAALSRQITGLETMSLRGDTGSILQQGLEDSTALYDQPFVMRGDGGQGDESVGYALQQWATSQGLQTVQSAEKAGLEGVEVIDFRRWAVGESSTTEASS